MKMKRGLESSPRTPEPSTPMKKLRSSRHASSPYHSPTANFLQSSPSTPNTVVSNYYANYFREIRVIGEGSYSSVFKVLSNVDGKYYAVKKTKKAYLGEKDRDKKLKEFQSLKELGNHPHCLNLHEAWEENGYLYLRTELCERGSLKQLIDETQSRNEMLKEEQIWNHVVDIALGLQHIHSYNYIHLDIKSENIFVADSGALKIGDFGLTFRNQEDIRDDSEGDPIYLAPEVLQAEYSSKVDIFSFGCILLELSSMEDLPQKGEEYQKLRHGNLSSFHLAMRSLELQDLIQRMLSQDPRQRPTASAILQQPSCRKIFNARYPQNPNPPRLFFSNFTSFISRTFASMFGTSNLHHSPSSSSLSLNQQQQQHLHLQQQQQQEEQQHPLLYSPPLATPMRLEATASAETPDVGERGYENDLAVITELSPQSPPLLCDDRLEDDSDQEVEGAEPRKVLNFMIDD